MFLGTFPSHLELPFVRHLNLLCVRFSLSKVIILQRGFSLLYLKCFCEGSGPFGLYTLCIIALIGDSDRNTFLVCLSVNPAT